jgi:HlyD family type I secretion membrane fusion protein
MPPVPSLLRRAANQITLFRRPTPEDDPLAGPISAFESETQAIFVRTTPYSEHAVVHVLAGIVLLSIVLMAVVKLDMVVTGTGMLNPQSGNLFVQPLDKAIIKDIKVRKGEFVKKGQVLAELDPTFARADVEQYQQHLDLDKALVARLEAEQADKPYVAGSGKSEQLQYSIWLSRQQEFKRQVENYDEQIKAAEATIVKAEKDMAYYSQHTANTARIAGMEEELNKKGYSSVLKQVTAEDARVENQRLMEESRNTRDGAIHDRDSLKAQRASYIGQWMDQLGTQLATTKDDLNQTEQTLSKAKKVSDLVTLEAPEDGLVLATANASPGMVFDPAPTAMFGVTPLFTLAPLNVPLEAEVDIPSSSDGFPKPGDPVQLKLDAYPFMRYGMVAGKIRTISEGSFTLDQNNQPTPAYFKAFVTIASNNLHDLPRQARLIPGMTLTGDVLVGRRTILSYLVEGGLRRASEGMREP